VENLLLLYLSILLLVVVERVAVALVGAVEPVDCLVLQFQ
jgi:hypothetical protein